MDNEISPGFTAQGLPDETVVERILTGDSASFELIMRRYNRLLYRIARGILRNEAKAEDAVQETYIRAYEKLASFQGGGRLRDGLPKSP